MVGPAPDLISKPKHDQIADKLAAYREATGDDDPFAKDWLAAIAAAEKTGAGCRGRLADFTKQAEGLLPAGVLGPFERDLAQLTALVHAGDPDALKADQLLRDSRRTFDELRGELRVLDSSDQRAVSQGAQSDLAAKLTRLGGKGGIEPERADAYRQRLAAEARRVAALRESLVAFDKAEPVTGMMRQGLGQLLADVGGEDADVRRWQAKLARVDDLSQRIGAIDRKEPVPEDLDRLFAAFEQMVGPNDAQLVGWRGKVLRINESRAALAVLDRRTAFAAAVVEPGLATLAELVGSGDRALLRWRAKATEVKTLKAELARLSATLAQSPEAQSASHARFRRLAQLIGVEDSEVQAAARRQDELDGPPRPSWADQGGRDSFGPWAEAGLPGARLRFRFVPSAQVQVGSPDGEAGRDADELPVTLRLPRAFWIAEVETAQALYAAVVGHDPSRFPGRDPALQPVERVSWDDAQAFIAALNVTVAGLGVRLPLEAEWELAARAGADQPWSLPAGLAADAEGVDKIAWTKANAGRQPRPARARLPNALGLYDMAGNLAEWVADTYGPWPTATVAVETPASGGDRRVLRGGSWGDDWLKTRAANRIPAKSDLRTAYAGFRLVHDVEWGGSPPDGTAVIAKAQQAAGTTPREISLGGWRVKLEREQ